MNYSALLDADVLTILRDVPGIVWTTDRELRFTSSHGAGLPLLGLEQGQVVGMTLAEFFATEDDTYLPIAAHHRALAGEEAVFQQEWNGHHFQTTVKPLRDASGAIVGCIGVAQDISEQRRADERVRHSEMLQEAIGRILGIASTSNSLESQLLGSLDVLLSLPWLQVQSRGAIFLVDQTEGRPTLKLVAQRGLPAPLLDQCAAVSFGSCHCGTAASEKRIVHSLSVDERPENRCPGMEHEAKYCVPIRADNELLGVLTLYLEPEHSQNTAEQQFLSCVATVIAGTLRIQRTEGTLREKEAELIAAAEIQKYLFPSGPPDVPGFSLAGRCYPAALSAGDHFDYLWMPDGALLIVLADVSGHGVGPAIVTAAFHSHFRSLAEYMTDPAEMVARVNTTLYRETAGETFVTLLAGRLDPAARTLSFVNAGHNPAILMNREGIVRGLLYGTSVPLAILPQAEFPLSDPLALNSGDVLLFYTDGLVEARSHERRLFDKERVIGVLREHRARTAEEILDALYLGVRKHLGAEPLHDDVTMVVVKVE